MSSRSENLSFLSFTSDLRDLYCKTKNSKVEKLFLRIAQENDEQFFKWLSSNRKIRDSLKNPEVYEALMVLVGIRREYPLQPTPDNPSPVAFEKGDVVRKVTGPDSIARRAPYILSFSNLLSNPSVASILNPFRDIVSKYAQTLSQNKNPVNSSAVLEDLTTIDQAYKQDSRSKLDEPYEDFVRQNVFKPKKVKETRQQKKTKMFAYLFRRFSEEISGAAQRAGNNFLANKITGEGILADPVSLTKMLKGNMSIEMLREAEKIAKDVLKGLDDSRQSYNYESIKMRIMMFSGAVMSNQLLNFYEKKKQEESKELTSLLSKDPEGQLGASIPSLPVQDKQWMNPKALQMVSAVLYFLYQASKRP